jgi:hypothetical protein
MLRGRTEGLRRSAGELDQFARGAAKGVAANAAAVCALRIFPRRHRWPFSGPLVANERVSLQNTCILRDVMRTCALQSSPGQRQG